MTTDLFISLVRKYTRARKLTPRMLNELIEKIEVFQRREDRRGVGAAAPYPLQLRGASSRSRN